MKKVLSLLSVLILSSLAVSASAADFKIASVDMQKALQGVEKGKKAKATLEKEFNEKKKQLQAEEEAIKKMTEDFKKQSMVLSDEAKAKKQNEIQDRMVKYRELFSKSQFDIQNRERELTDPIIGKLREAVEEIGKAKGFTMIIEKNDSSILYSSSQEDLTDEVIKSFNKKNG